MCVIIDTTCLGPVFDGRNRKHGSFIPVLDWINGKGYMIYGGTKYATELGKAPKFLPFIVELSKKRRTIQIPSATVDPIAADLKRKIPEAAFDDEHLVALVIASHCCVVCTMDKVAMEYIKRADRLGYRGVPRPKIYQGHKRHAELCCEGNIVGLCASAG